MAGPGHFGLTAVVLAQVRRDHVVVDGAALKLAKNRSASSTLMPLACEMLRPPTRTARISGL